MELRSHTTIYGVASSVSESDAAAKVQHQRGYEIAVVNISPEHLAIMRDNPEARLRLEGVAVWDTDTYAIHEFRPTSCQVVPPSDPWRLFEELARVTGHAWAGVDARAWVRDLRGYDDEEE